MKTLHLILFIVFLIIATIYGEHGKIGYAIGYAVLSLSSLILAVARTIVDNIKSPTN